MKLGSTRAVITGGASGLGLATTEALLAGGAQVSILDLQATEAQAAMASAMHRFDVDVSDQAAVDEAMVAAAQAMGGITLAVNCAGIVHGERLLGREALHSREAFARVVDVNLYGSFNVCRAAADLMQDNPPDGGGERGVIINTSSIAAFDGQIGQAAYAAAKGGIASLTLPLARELGTFGIRVMAIAPGLFDTPMTATIPAAVRADLSARTPFPKRLGAASEFAALVCHIVRNPMLNGSLIRLDGGLRM